LSATAAMAALRLISTALGAAIVVIAIPQAAG
jgi:hypothetical protein